MLSLAAENLLSPIILSFALGLFAALARSDLSVPEAAAKARSIYLLFAIGFKGGVSVAAHGLDATLLLTLAAGFVLSASLPLIAFVLLQTMTGLSRIDAAAVAAHYGSISIVTFVAASSVLTSQGLVAEGYMVAVAAVMEAPAIVSALWLVSRGGGNGETATRMDAELAIGATTGEDGRARISSFVVAPFQGGVGLFLLDMGLVAGRGLRQGGKVLRPGVLGFGLLMPLVSASIGAMLGLAIGRSTGGVMLLMTLAASASYIAVPAAMRVALPKADPSVSLTLSLGVTFPFNLTIGIPLYLAVATMLTGG